jgi:hypothetical protein
MKRKIGFSYYGSSTMGLFITFSNLALRTWRLLFSVFYGLAIFTQLDCFGVRERSSTPLKGKFENRFNIFSSQFCIRIRVDILHLLQNGDLVNIHARNYDTSTFGVKIKQTWPFNFLVSGGFRVLRHLDGLFFDHLFNEISGEGWFLVMEA